jgi:hypothetical protein
MYFVIDDWDEYHKFANAGGCRRFTMVEQNKEDEKRRCDRWDRIRKHAMEQGIIMVQLSPRKYALVELSTASGMSGARSDEHKGKFFSVPCGDVLFTGTHAACVKEFEARVDPLPACLCVE